MRRIIGRAVLLALIAVPAVRSAALPDCGHSQLRCGVKCQYQPEWGGACFGTADSPTSYCWWEVRQSDYGSWWTSCHSGAYDVCCDESSPN
jgi:hypothetical protein